MFRQSTRPAIIQRRPRAFLGPCAPDGSGGSRNRTQLLVELAARRTQVPAPAMSDGQKFGFICFAQNLATAAAFDIAPAPIMPDGDAQAGGSLLVSLICHRAPKFLIMPGRPRTVAEQSLRTFSVIAAASANAAPEVDAPPSKSSVRAAVVSATAIIWQLTTAKPSTAPWSSPILKARLACEGWKHAPAWEVDGVQDKAATDSVPGSWTGVHSSAMWRLKRWTHYFAHGRPLVAARVSGSSLKSSFIVGGTKRPSSAYRSSFEIDNAAITCPFDRDNRGPKTASESHLSSLIQKVEF